MQHSANVGTILQISKVFCCQELLISHSGWNQQVKMSWCINSIAFTLTKGRCCFTHAFVKEGFMCVARTQEVCEKVKVLFHQEITHIPRWHEILTQGWFVLSNIIPFNMCNFYYCSSVVTIQTQEHCCSSIR